MWRGNNNFEYLLLNNALLKIAYARNVTLTKVVGRPANKRRP